MGAVLAAVLVCGFVLLEREVPYRVHARFVNASQLVRGNLVQVAGRPVGEVEEIDLTSNGRADVTLRIDNDLAPLREGTQITVRQASLSGVANRYLDLRLAPDTARDLPDGATIPEQQTTTAVDLDQLFATLDPKTRTALRDVVRGSALQYMGQGEQYGEGLMYLNPSLVASSRFFRELNRDNGLLERFVVSSSQFVTDLAERKTDLASLIDNLQTTTDALGDQQAPLREAIGRLPGFMRRANTTFVNLRGTLDDLDPLVRDSKPVAKALRPFLAQLRPLANDARPTLRDLSALLERPGADNDLVELTRAQVPVAKVAVGPVTANGEQREGALPASARALATGTGRARVRPPVRARPARLVRRLQPLGRVRRARRHQPPGRPRRRVHDRRRAARAGPAAAARPGLPRLRRRARAGQPLPRRG